RFARRRGKSASGVEQRKVDAVGHDLKTGGGRVEMVAAIDGGGKARRVFRIAGDGVEIDHAVEFAAVADPVVDGLAVGFALGAKIGGEAFERHDGGADHADAVA